MGISRRDLLKVTSASGLVAAGLAASEGFFKPLLAEDEPTQVYAESAVAQGQTQSGEMSYRTLGRTGERVSAIGLGGHHIGRIREEQESIKLIRSAIDRGINFMDNSWDYHNGRSHRWMGAALKDGYRQKVFLMTKIDGRTKGAAAMQIDEIIRMEDPDRIFAPGGAMEAVLEAQKAGKIRYIGFTGHKDPLVHLRVLEIAAQNNFRFDAVQ